MFYRVFITPRCSLGKLSKRIVLYCIDKKVIATVNKDLLSPILEREIYVGVVSYRVSQTVGDGKSPACY